VQMVNIRQANVCLFNKHSQLINLHWRQCTTNPLPRQCRRTKVS
jgi:hypothetical protein